MAGGDEWRRLPIPKKPKVSTLYYRLSRTDAGFALDITDLLQIWKAEYSKQDILRQAARDKTSIDPNEDPSQLNVLISKIEECLAGTARGRLSFRLGESDMPRSFWMKACMPLPAPLKPLEWQFLLECCSPQSLTNELVLPLIETQALTWEGVQSLKDVIEQKDTIISKLLDKLEGSAVDLGSIFPGVVRGGKRGFSVQHALKVVPGLSRFNHEEWQRKFGLDKHPIAATRALVESSRPLRVNEEGNKSPKDQSTEPSLNWMNELPWEFEAFHSSPTSPGVKEERGTSPDKSDSDETASDDDFEVGQDVSRKQADIGQRQATPPAHDQTAGKERGTSGASSPDPSSAHKGAAKPNDRGHKTKKLGTLGGVQTKETPDPCPGKLTTTNKPLTKQGGSQSEITTTDSDSDLSEDLSSQRELVKRNVEHGKATTKLGTIGGKKQQQQQQQLSNPEPSIQEVDSRGKSTPPTQNKSKPKLGAIGGHKAKLPERNLMSPTPEQPPKRKADEVPTSSSAALPDEIASERQKAIQHGETAKPEETEEEKADRKRHELRSKLEQGPTQKKKRKF